MALPDSASLHVGLVGYGEVGKIFTQALAAKGLASVGAWDLRFRDSRDGAQQRAHAAQAGITVYDGAAALCARSNLVISAVTASSTLAVAREVAASIRPGSIFLDLNSASPGTKAQAAQLIDATGAHYVEAGVMTSVPPYGLAVPMLLGGAQAASLADALRALGCNATAVAAEIGVASAIKMCRCVMIKGLEALVIESYTTARRHGVEKAMLATLAETFPGIDWEKQGAYFFSRVAQHGQRRSEEMAEAAVTVREAGFDPIMAAAISQKHGWMAGKAQAGVFEGISKNATWQEYADRLLKG
jgi:3-hydroxyisobutyrate dehydrogenase-like beta-hydroxyacid dehydrogenase